MNLNELGQQGAEVLQVTTDTFWWAFLKLYSLGNIEYLPKRKIALMNGDFWDDREDAMYLFRRPRYAQKGEVRQVRVFDSHYDKAGEPKEYLEIVPAHLAGKSIAVFKK